jgi:hypothetical protein
MKTMKEQLDDVRIIQKYWEATITDNLSQCGGFNEFSEEAIHEAIDKTARALQHGTGKGSIPAGISAFSHADYLLRTAARERPATAPTMGGEVNGQQCAQLAQTEEANG